METEAARGAATGPRAPNIPARASPDNGPGRSGPGRSIPGGSGRDVPRSATLMCACVRAFVFVCVRVRALPFFLRGLACFLLLHRGSSAMLPGFIDQSARCSVARCSAACQPTDPDRCARLPRLPRPSRLSATSTELHPLRVCALSALRHFVWCSESARRPRHSDLLRRETEVREEEEEGHARAHARTRTHRGTSLSAKIVD